MGDFVIAPVEVRPNPARVLPMLFGVCALVLGAGAVVGDPAVVMPLRLLAPIGAALGSALIIVLWTRARKARITVDATALEFAVHTADPQATIETPAANSRIAWRKTADSPLFDGVVMR